MARVKLDQKSLEEIYPPEVAATIIREIDTGPPVIVDRLVTDNGRTAVKQDVYTRREALERGITTLPHPRDAVNCHISATRSEYPTKAEAEAHRSLLETVR